MSVHVLLRACHSVHRNPEVRHILQVHVGTVVVVTEHRTRKLNAGCSILVPRELRLDGTLLPNHQYCLGNFGSAEQLRSAGKIVWLGVACVGAAPFP
jgi:hypothetical protein